MKKEIAEKWVAALKSGKYQQTKQILKDDKGYCCLGVLCLLYGEETGATFECIDGNYYFNGKLGLLPNEVMVWAGINTDTGYYGKSVGSLSNDNDDGKSFKEIADIIIKYQDEL